MNKEKNIRYVPVVDKDQKPLMPTTPRKARLLVKSKQATYFFKNGIYCIRLNYDPETKIVQPIVVGIDPGSKREGFTLKSKAHTYLNIQLHAVDWIKERIETRRNLRKSRRYRKTPYRACRLNRGALKSINRLAPSTKARWNAKLRLCKKLVKIFPITDYIVEDIKAKTKKGNNQKKWNQSFSPLENGKKWFYEELEKMGTLHLKQGFDTHTMREALGLKKDKKNKLSNSFDAHCVDSWVLANSISEGHTIPDNKTLLEMKQLEFHRRQLHEQLPKKGGIRKQYGSTRSLGFQRGSLVFHKSSTRAKSYGLCLIGGTSKGLITLVDKNCFEKQDRLTERAKKEDIKHVAYNNYTVRYVNN